LPVSRRTRVKTRRHFINDRDFFDSERSKASQKRTKQARVKTRGSFYSASVGSLHVSHMRQNLDAALVG
jgi:hypothetical protein